jgi:hypothetical protein
LFHGRPQHRGIDAAAMFEVSEEQTCRLGEASGGVARLAWDVMSMSLKESGR